MIANAKPQSFVTSELVVFLGETEAFEFGEWLWAQLAQDGEVVTSVLDKKPTTTTTTSTPVVFVEKKEQAATTDQTIVIKTNYPTTTKKGSYPQQQQQVDLARTPVFGATLLLKRHA